MEPVNKVKTLPIYISTVIVKKETGLDPLNMKKWFSECCMFACMGTFLLPE
jgi:hypothetical protein